MPIYEYRCRSCDRLFEELIRRAADSESVVCPGCGRPQPERLLSAPTLSSMSSSFSGSSSGGSSCVPRGGFS